MKLFTVREHEGITVARDRVADANELSVSQANRLTDLKKQYRAKVFGEHSNLIKATQFVGIAVAGDAVVEVLPKISGLDDEKDDTKSKLRINLVQMLSKTRRLDIRAGEMTALGRQANLLEIIVRLFCERLFTEVHRSLVHRYEPQEDNLFVLRGKLDITRQAKFNAAHPERFYCQYDEFHADNPLNQVLKAAVAFLKKLSSDTENQRRLAELYFALDGISEIHPAKLEWHRIHLDRSSKRFHVLVNLARLFLRSEHQDVSCGKREGFSLMFDMNRLFEEYIGEVAREKLANKDIDVRLQKPQKALLLNVKEKTDAFLAKPDIVGLADKKIEWIIDTKWKVLDEDQGYCGVNQSDIYQMMGYSHRYDCKNVLLLYPHHAEISEKEGVQTHYVIYKSDGNAGDYSIRVTTVCLKDISKVSEQLKKLIEDTQVKNALPPLPDQIPFQARG